MIKVLFKIICSLIYQYLIKKKENKPSIMPIRTEHLGKSSHMQFELVHLNHEAYLMMGCVNDD